MKRIFDIITIYRAHRLILVSMVKREIGAQYHGSIIGIFWYFIQPMVMIGVFWFIFSIGFKVKPTNNVPFVVWLTAGMAPWFAFSEIINNSVHAIIGHSNLIKKTIFPSEILPGVKVLSGLFSHAVFLLILLLLILLTGGAFSFFFIQVFYYLFCLCVLIFSFAFMLSALMVFLRDIAQVVAVILQVGFWATPIFWNIDIMPGNIQFLLKLNPVYYIVQGYRESFLYDIPFWYHWKYCFYFWGITFSLLIFGIFVFKKLQPQFPDVL